MGFINDLFSLDKHDVIVQEPSLSGKFFALGIPDRKSAQNIYATPDIQKQLSAVHPELLKTAAEVAGSDYVIFVSREDIEPEIRKLDKQNGMERVLHDSEYPDYGNAFLAFGSTFANPPMIVSAGSAEDAYNQNASAGFFKHDNETTYCTITLPNMNKTTEDRFKRTAGIKNTMVNEDKEIVLTQVNIPESEILDNASTAFILFHEAGHCAKEHTSKGASTAKVLRQEQEADNIGAEVTKYLFSDKGRKAAQIKQDARSVGAIKFLHDPDHNVNLDLHRYPSISSQDQIDAMRFISESIIEQSAKDIETSTEEAIELLNSDPKFKHETLNKLDQLGKFKGNPVAQKYIFDYMAVTKRCAPEYFGIEPDSSSTLDNIKSEVPSENLSPVVLQQPSGM